MHMTWQSQLPQPLLPLLLAGCFCLQPAAPSARAPSSRCQCALVAAGTTHRRAHARSALLKRSTSHYTLLRALFIGVSITSRCAMGVCVMVSLIVKTSTCLQGPQKSAWMSLSHILIMQIKASKAHKFLLTGYLYHSF